jgi:hypothetical protein
MKRKDRIMAFPSKLKELSLKELRESEKVED